MRLSPGARLGPYEVLSVLGTGGMGEVYLARDHRLERRVAIKARHLGDSTSAEERRRVLHEGRAAARLSHPRIAPVFDVIEDQDTSFLVMEYVEGRTLRSLLRNGPLPVPRAVALGLELCEALASAHGNGVVHGDVKPENLCIAPDGHLKVLDFGIARIVRPAAEPAAAATVTEESLRAGRFAGTPQYAAPEQFEGAASSIRSDIYGAGAVIFEMLTGQPPFPGRDALEIGLRALTGEAPRADQVHPPVPAAVADVVAAALRRSPEARLQSADELASALRSTRTGTANVWTPETTPAAVLPRTIRQRWRVPAGVLALAVLITLGWAAWRTVGGSSSPATATTLPVVAILPLEGAGNDQRAVSLGTGLADTMIANLASVPGVVVVARSTSAAAAAYRSDLRRVSRDLGSTFVVDGSVQSLSGRVRVTLTLVRADGSVAWGRTYEGLEDDVSGLQRQLAGGLTDALALRLSAPERQRLGRPATVNTAALAAYATAREKLSRADLAGNVALAVSGFRRALELDPGFALARAGLADAYGVEFRQTRDPAALERAIPEVQEALRVDPYQGAAYVSLGTIYTEAGRVEEARAAFERAIALQPNNDDAYRGLGVAHARGGQKKEATQALEKAIGLRPGFWLNHHEYGRLLFTQGRLDEAAHAFQTVITLQPDSPRGYQALGTVYQSQDKLELALENYRRAHQYSPSVNLALNLGVVEHWMGRFEAAVSAFGEAASLAPNDPTPARNMGDSYLRMGKKAEARDAYQRALGLTEAQLRVDQSSPLTLSDQAVLLAKLGRFSEADTVMRRAAALAPEDNEMVFRQAVVSALAGRVNEARQQLQHAIDLGFPVALAAHDDDVAPLLDNTTRSAGAGR